MLQKRYTAIGLAVYNKLNKFTAYAKNAYIIEYVRF